MRPVAGSRNFERHRDIQLTTCSTKGTGIFAPPALVKIDRAKMTGAVQHKRTDAHRVVTCQMRMNDLVIQGQKLTRKAFRTLDATMLFTKGRDTGRSRRPARTPTSPWFRLARMEYGGLPFRTLKTHWMTLPTRCMTIGVGRPGSAKAWVHPLSARQVHVRATVERAMPIVSGCILA